jgi:endoglucanase Acf2
VFNRGYEAGAGMVSDEIDALMRDVEALSGDDAAFSMLRHPSVSGGDEWWNW